MEAAVGVAYNNKTMSTEMPNAVNYQRWLFSSFERYLNKSAVTLEIGAGHCGYTRLLKGVSRRLIVTDIDKNVLDDIVEEMTAVEDIEAVQMDGIECDKINSTVDNIVAINILEHVKDDVLFIHNCSLILNKGGILILFVPAFPILFSNLDKQAGHFRRYRKEWLENTVKKNGLSVVYSRYFNFIGFWGWLMNKLIESNIQSMIVGQQVRFFDKLVWLIRKFEILAFICGQSILLVGKKP